MGCPSKLIIGDNLTFSITTHDPDTGVLTDTDVDPIYRLYEDEVAIPILTGIMSKLDDVNTTGFYVETVAGTVANGFEDGKSYNIYVEATVDGDTGGISYAFKAALEYPIGTYVEHTYIVQTPAGVPIEGVEVWYYTDATKTNVVWHGNTDTFGQARDQYDNKPRLDAGTYHLVRQKSGYTFPDIDVEVAP